MGRKGIERKHRLDWTPTRTLPILLITFVVLNAGCATFSRTHGYEAEPFTIVALPDTQYYSLHYPEIFRAQTEWIAENAEELNVLCVIHEGDITDENSEPEWLVADEAMSILDEAVPYCMTIGNHDMGEGGHAQDRNTDLFNRYFPPSRFEQEPWYGDRFAATQSENTYYLFNPANMKLMVLCLEFGPRDEVLDWANHVVSEHRDYRVVVVTHCYMNYDDTRVDAQDEYNPHTYPCDGNDGEQKWEKFVRKHDNIFLVLSGHVPGDGLGRLTSYGNHGNKVHQVVANYQMHPNGGDGWLRIMKFIPGKDKILVRSYSPQLRKYARDRQNQFKLKYEME